MVSELDIRHWASEDVGPENGNEAFFIRVETSHQQMCFKIVRLTMIRNGSKRTIPASSGLWLLQQMS